MNKNLTTAIVIVVVILIATISASYYFNLSSTHSLNKATIRSNNPREYRNGTYKVTGNYVSPGGAEEIGVTLTLLNGVIVYSSVEVRAEREISLEKQADFATNYKSLVVGKNINEVFLTKVSGSSLTPQGFNDAVEKIKKQAESS